MISQADVIVIVKEVESDRHQESTEQPDRHHLARQPGVKVPNGLLGCGNWGLHPVCDRMCHNRLSADEGDRMSADGSQIPCPHD